MTPTVTAGATGDSGVSRTVGWSDSVGTDLALEAGASGGQRVAGYVFIAMDGLGVLAQIVQSRKSPTAVTLKGSFSGMLSIGKTNQ